MSKHNHCDCDSGSSKDGFDTIAETFFDIFTGGILR